MELMIGFYVHHKNRARDDNNLYIGVKITDPSTPRLNIHLDCDKNGLFYGSDNLLITFANNTVEQVLLRDAEAAIGAQDYVETQKSYFSRFGQNI